MIFGLKTNDVLLVKEVISTDNEVDRFNLYLNRLLNQPYKIQESQKKLVLNAIKTV